MDIDCSFQLGGDCYNKDGRNSTSSVNNSCHGQLFGQSSEYNYGCVTIENEVENKIPPLIDNETKHILELYLNVIAFFVTSSLGVIGNIINIAVYWKQGLSDSISLGFFALSVSDLVLVAMPLFTGSLYAAKYAIQDSPIDFSSIHYVSFGWVRNFTYSCSLLITAFLSLERCCCIILPFKVQTLFTRKKTAIFLSVMVLFHATCLFLLPLIVQLKWQSSSPVKSNSSKKLRVKFSDFGREMEVFYSTSMSFIVPVGCQVIVTVCAFVMVRGLKKASRFRAQATSGGDTRTEHAMTVFPREKMQSEHHKESCGDKGDLDSRLPQNSQRNVLKKSEKYQADSSNSSTLSPRDARLVKTMIFIVSILSACNVPFLAATFAWRLVPDLNIGKPYANTLSVVFSVVYILGNINASVNVIVYYKTSSRFREVTKELFARRKKK